MIKEKIKAILLKIHENKVKKIQANINKPLKSFDDAIIRVKNLISIWSLNDAEAILNSLLSVENKNYENFSINVDISENKKNELKKKYDNNLLRIKNLQNLIKSKKLWVSFTNVEEFWYTDTLKIIRDRIKTWNFIDARLFLKKLKQKEVNLYNILISKKNNTFLKKFKYRILFMEKSKIFYDLEFSIFYNEMFRWIAFYSNINSLVKILKYIIKNKDFELFEKIIPQIKNFEDKILKEIFEDSNINSSLKSKYKSRNNSVMLILKKMHWVYYKEKTGLSIELSSVKTIKDTFIVINDFAKSYNFSKSLEALYELRNKETNSFEAILGDQSIWKKDKDKLLKKFRSFENSLNKLENKINTDKSNYEKKAHIKDLAIKNKQTEKQLYLLINQKHFDDAFELLETYKKTLWNDIDKYAIFCEKWKFKILKTKQKFVWLKNKKQNLIDQAKDIMWENIDIQSQELDLEKESSNSFINILNAYYNKYKLINKARRDKLLLDNIDSLLNSSNKIKEDVIKSKLEKVHSGLVKDTDWIFMDWYSVYWKTLWADRISWDTFSFYDFKNWKRFFIWDATGHGIKAWFMISLLTQSFHVLVNAIPTLKELVVLLNNKLKQDLSSWNFITSIFFELDYNDKNNLKFIWMWHEPMFFCKKSDLSVEKIYPGWIAAWMTNLKDQAFLKEKTIHFDIWDVLLLYTDWIVEARNINWDMYSIDRIKDTFFKAVSLHSDSKDIYNYIYNDLISFVNKTKFYDDVTIIVIKRDNKKEFLNENKVIEDILKSENISKKYVKNLKWKSKDQIEAFLKVKRKEREIVSILKNLRSIFKTWDLVALKKESQRYIKEWFIHKDIVKYLQYSIENENFAKIEQQNIRLQNKYETLVKLLKAWQYDTVLEEASNIVMNEWKI